MSYKEAAVIISGGSKGIGLEIAKVFSANTNRPIVLIARNEDELNLAKEQCKKSGASKVHILTIDLTDEHTVKQTDFSQYKPGILINNAGSFLFKKLAGTSEEEFTGQFQSNTLAAFHLTKAVLPEMHIQERGLIVNISSMSALKGMASSGAYVMSKHALLGYTRSLRKELRKSKIAVTAINLGQTYSTSWKEVDIDPAKLIDSQDIGRLILFLSELSPRTVAEEIILMPQGGEVKQM